VCSIPAAQQLSSGTIKELFLAAIQHRTDYCLGQIVCTELLLQLPAGEALSSETIARLLLVAMLEDYISSDLEEFYKLPAAKQLSSREVLDLWTVVVERNHFSNRSRTLGAALLCQLPSAQQLSSSAAWHTSWRLLYSRVVIQSSTPVGEAWGCSSNRL
jgi:hypothetical protein